MVTDFGKKVKLKLVPNPSHLETVGPITEGMVRSQIDSVYHKDFDKAAAIITHTNEITTAIIKPNWDLYLKESPMNLPIASAIITNSIEIPLFFI